MPAPKFMPTGPKMTTSPPVIYSHPFEPHPSTTAVAPELRTQKRSPTLPLASNNPEVAPYNTVLPIMTLSSAKNAAFAGGRRVIIPPDSPLPT